MASLRSKAQRLRIPTKTWTKNDPNALRIQAVFITDKLNKNGKNRTEKRRTADQGKAKRGEYNWIKDIPKAGQQIRAKPDGLSQIGAQQQDRKSARSQAASHLTGLMRKHVRVCGAAPKLQKTRK